MLAKRPAISWWESNSASLHQTQGASDLVLTVAPYMLSDHAAGAEE